VYKVLKNKKIVQGAMWFSPQGTYYVPIHTKV